MDIVRGPYAGARRMEVVAANHQMLVGYVLLRLPVIKSRQAATRFQELWIAPSSVEPHTPATK